MVPEELRGSQYSGVALRQCGEHIDPLILEHRRRMQTPEGAKALREKAGKAELN